MPVHVLDDRGLVESQPPGAASVLVVDSGPPVAGESGANRHQGRVDGGAGAA